MEKLGETPKTYSRKALIIVAIFAILAGGVVGGLIGAGIVAKSKLGKVADSAAELTAKVDSTKAEIYAKADVLHEKYGDKLGNILDTIMDEKVVEVIQKVDAETLAAAITTQSTQTIEEAGAAAKATLGRLRKKIEDKE